MDHLILLIHGFNGSPSNFDNFERVLKIYLNPLSKNLVVKLCSNQWNTYDGIEKGAKRLFPEVLEVLRSNPSLTKMSLIGHSMGGLLARYLIKLLHDHNVFSSIQPWAFVTLATPHLSIRRSPSKSLFNFIFVHFLPYFCQSLREMMMEDSDHLLHKMAVESSFLIPLGLFSKRVLYSNIFYDLQVPYSTGSIQTSNPYRHETSIPSIPSYPSLAVRKQPGPTPAFVNDSKRLILSEMCSSLNVLSWERCDCLLSAITAHSQIVNKRAFFQRDDLIRHVAITYLI